jgi:NAD(P)H-flavin reductase/hemoglobin-like flavoprotein
VFTLVAEPQANPALIPSNVKGVNVRDLSRTLKESWSLIEDRQDKLAGQFYARMFLADPQLRELFPVQMDQTRSRLLAALLTAIQNVDEPELLDDYLRGLGRDHRKYHAGPAHYEQMGRALLESLRDLSGDQWCAEYDTAWQEAYRVISGRMQAGAAEAEGPAMWHAEVIAHERRSRDIAVFTCRPLRPLGYRAGQHVSIECGYQPRQWRVYSVANAPRQDGLMQFHVRAVRGAGWVSGALVRRLKPGDMLRLASPMGSMTINRRCTRDIVCVAGGTGLAPIKALVEELGRFNRTRWVHLFFGARTEDDLYDLPDLGRLAARYPWLSVVPACSHDRRFVGERGNVADVLARYGPWTGYEFFVSGPPPMITATLGRLAQLGVPADRIHYDPPAAH